MYILLLGIFVFLGVHLVPSMIGFRSKIIAKLGEVLYKGLYSIISLIGLLIIVYGKSIAGFHPIWEPPVWSRNVTIVIMLFSFYFFAAADIKSNIKRFIRHPMLLGITLWSGAHLIANGDLASILLFGSFFVFSLFGMLSANKRGAIVQEKKYPLIKDLVSVISGLIAYAVFIKYLHPYLIGVSVI